MIKILIPVIFFFSTICLSQEMECQYPPTGDYTGICESFYSDGNIRSQTEFLNGLRHGKHREYYRNGQLAASAEYFEESYIGKLNRYSRDNVMLFNMKLDSNETGKFVYYSEDGKQILVTGQFKKSYRDGKWKFYNESGNLIDKRKYNSDETRREIYGDGTSNNIFIPYDETIDKLFLEDYGLPIEIRPETIIDVPDIPAEFHEGTDGMKEFIRVNVNYPTSAIMNSEEGKVYLSFIVELDGSISRITLLRGVCESLDQEAIRLIKIMPKWKPGIYNNQLVRSKCILPISFVLQSVK